MPVCSAGWVWGYLPTRSSISAGRSSRAGLPRRAPTPSPEFLRHQSSEDHLFVLSEQLPPLSGPKRRPPPRALESLRPQSSEDHLFVLPKHPPPLSPEPPPQGLGQPI